MQIAEKRITPRIANRFKAWLLYLNSQGHEKALWLYMAVVLAHWAEHLVQAYQVWVLTWPRPISLGLAGFWFPGLVKSELLHWSYAVFMFLGLILLRPGFQGRSRLWWTISLVIQGWHLFEHSLLQGQALLGSFLFNATIPMSVVQIWVPRVELHLFYNAAVFIPMVIGMYYHLYPPAKENSTIRCTCVRH